jgi:hypothetical protein
MHRPRLVAALALVLPTAAAWAAQPKQTVTDLDQRAFFKPELYISSAHAPLADVQSRLPNQAAWDAFFQARLAAGQEAVHVYIDPRSGAVTNIIGAFPIIPGSGAGNAVTLESLAQALGRPVPAVDAEVVGALVRRFVTQHRAVLGIDLRQLGPIQATQVRPDLWQVSAPQVVRGVPVRYGRLAASISHGNLVTIGTETWGDARVNVQPEVGADFALDAGFAQAGGRTVSDLVLQAPALEIVPVSPAAQKGEGWDGAVGTGYEHRLVWSFIFQRAGEGARWEVLVDAHSGDVLALQDVNQYVQRQITGGVYPITSTEICPTPLKCGTMQLGTPMPFANTGLAAPNNFTNSAGILDWSAGTVTTTLSGRFVRIVDNCGAVSNSGTGDVPMGGVNGQHDCTSAGGGAGNTASSRSAFYEVNRIAELARGYLPGNTWLNSQLTANVNINQTCNGFWNGSTINFYRSGGGCRNTGELAGVFDHEWGHGMDDNDAAGALSNSSEAYGDIAGILRYQDSCVGHGFFWTSNSGCGQTADGTGFNANEAQQGAAHCDLDCSGVRDADYLKHNPNTPDTALGYVCTSCLSSTGPCGRQVHCAAAPTRQAAWDLVARDLQQAPFNFDSQTAFIIGNKLFYQGSGNVGAWHACTCGSSSSGCGTTNGYMQWITADDDNGNLSDGTPHMQAIFAAYNRHGIACATPTAVNSGCAGGPNGTVVGLTATPGNYQVVLNWAGAVGATRYWVFRTEGHAGCNFGKTLIAETTALTYTDTQVANGRTYYYNVVPAGASSACYGRAGTCVNATPAPSATPDFTLTCTPASLSVQQGSSGIVNCTVGSVSGFAAPVTLACAGLPAGASCSFSPNPATPPANSSVGSQLTITVSGGTGTGTFPIQATGTSGALSHSAAISLTVTAAPVPDFTVACTPASFTIQQGNSGTSNCTVTSVNGFAGLVSLDCTGQPAGVTCGYSPVSVTPTASSTLTLSVATTTATGPYVFQARGTSGTLVRTANLSLTVTGVGGGPQTAVFDPARQAPACNTVGSSCDTGATLVRGRDNMSGGLEPNQPNTLNDSCADGGSGTFHTDESNDQLKVSTVDGTDFAVGKQVRIDATVWVWPNGPTSDHLDLYYTANAAAASPTWVFLTTINPTTSQGGQQTFSATYTLPSGGTLQAVRSQFRYQGTTPTPCLAGNYNDRDDLVFAVNGGTPPPPPAPDVTATFDATLQAPRCTTVGKSCDSGATLLLGRDTLATGSEPNQPNTINDSCGDGTSGTFHSDESNDRLRVETVDGTAFAAGKTVRVTATVWAWPTTPSADKLDLYFAANAASPTWTFIGTLTPSVGGTNALSATYVLPTGAAQAVRARFRYQGSASACTVGSFDDHDDLVFAVQ